MADYTDLIGTPFKLGGRDKSVGLDCYGLVTEMYKRYGVEIPEYDSQYNSFESAKKLLQGELSTNPIWREIGMNDMPIPSLLAIRFNVPKGFVNHTAVYIGEGKFIHTRSKIGVCVDRINSPAWRRLIEGCYEYVGDNNGEISNN